MLHLMHCTGPTKAKYKCLQALQARSARTKDMQRGVASLNRAPGGICGMEEMADGTS